MYNVTMARDCAIIVTVGK